MKKMLFTILLLAFGLAHAGANDPVFTKRNAANTGQASAVYAAPTSQGILIYDPAVADLSFVTLGSNLSITSGIINSAGGGTPGATGPAGPKGDKGDTGADGIQGPAGAAGAKGDTGLQGPKGDTGSTGSAGTTGAQGVAGAKGDQGIQGVKGDTGSQGTTGPTGSAGPPNTLSIGTVTTGTAAVTITGTSPSQVLNFVVPQGIQGATGNTGSTGAPGSDATVKAYVGTTLKTSVFSIFKQATVTSGTATFQLTADGASTGTALFAEAFTESINFNVNDAAASYQIGWAFSNSNKTLTATVNKLGTANILTGILGQVAAPNGTVVYLQIKGR